mmetsp:Transcript_12377/g.23317  ORF Transcript_12377/g.23317 Transcript_12377/m.23317 type:complete len:258 (+) Transcript_12377:914-1687(+)
MSFRGKDVPDLWTSPPSSLQEGSHSIILRHVSQSLVAVCIAVGRPVQRIFKKIAPQSDSIRALDLAPLQIDPTPRVGCQFTERLVAHIKVRHVSTAPPLVGWVLVLAGASVSHFHNDARIDTVVPAVASPIRVALDLEAVPALVVLVSGVDILGPPVGESRDVVRVGNASIVACTIVDRVTILPVECHAASRPLGLLQSVDRGRGDRDACRDRATHAGEGKHHHEQLSREGLHRSHSHSFSLSLSLSLVSAKGGQME